MRESRRPLAPAGSNSSDSRQQLKFDVEAAVDTFGDAIAAQAEGCSRIELCGPLHDGGTTPSAGLIERCCARLTLSIHVLVRPRHGDFVYNGDEIAIMMKDIAISKELGAEGIVTGALSLTGSIDSTAMEKLISAARPMRVGFHRAFDSLTDQRDGLEQLISLGVDHVLTSGGQRTAADGASNLASLVKQAGDRITILAGGSIAPDNVIDLVERTGVRIVHGRAFRGMLHGVSDRTTGASH